MGVSIKQRDRRELMTKAAVELLEQDGPNAMTVRKITAKIGVSSIAVYSEFSSMKNLVASVVDYGFLQLLKKFKQLAISDNVLTDLWNTVCVIRDFSLGHRHLYSVMFAAESVGGYQRSGQELEQGIETLKFLHQLCTKAVEENFFTTTPMHATQHIWATMHGRLMLELAGYLANDTELLESYGHIIATSMIGLGAKADAVSKSIKINYLD
ncbi:TetR/AcrR family transcriptional regulator [Acinetobacter haemolyticus]|uniref:TetR/AcrR family transcriptional regulator n=1 Tax=Acinetobacter haemolyticus TaxID=29430 RepID=UPI003F54F9CD